MLLARGWQSTVNRQRDERLDRTKVAQTSTIGGALANYENALQGARSLWLASDGVAGWDGREAAPPTGRWSPGPTRPCTPPRRVGGTVLRRPHRRGRGGGVPGSGVPEPPQGHGGRRHQHRHLHGAGPAGAGRWRPAGPSPARRAAGRRWRRPCLVCLLPASFVSGAELASLPWSRTCTSRPQAIQAPSTPGVAPPAPSLPWSGRLARRPAPGRWPGGPGSHRRATQQPSHPRATASPWVLLQP